MEPEAVANDRRQTERRRGRQSRVEGELSSKRVWLWLTVTERAALARIAEETHQPIGAVIREAVNSYVGDFEDDHPIFPSRVNRRMVDSTFANSKGRPRRLP